MDLKPILWDEDTQDALMLFHFIYVRNLLIKNYGFGVIVNKEIAEAKKSFKK